MGDAGTRAPATRRPSLAWIVKKVFAQSQEDDVSGLAAELAFQFFLALFPFIIFLGAMGSLMARLLGIENPADEAVGLLGSNLPQSASEAVRGVVSDTLSRGNNNLLSLTVLGAIWAATAGTDTLFKAMNRAYDVAETRPLWRRYLLAICLTLIAAPLLLLSFLGLVVVQAYGSVIADALRLEDVFRTAINILRWPVVATLVAVVADLLYRLAPNLSRPPKWRAPGAVLFSIGWLVATYVFGLYVSSFSSFGTIYGVLGGVAVLMVWFYMSAFVLILGAEVNAVVQMVRQPEWAEVQPLAMEEEANQRRAV